MTLQDYFELGDHAHEKSLELNKIPGRDFECGFAAGVASVLFALEHLREVTGLWPR